jgi:predicted transcriptional regulator
MASTSFRVDRETHDKLKEIAEKENASLGRVIDDLITSYERAEFRR